MKRFRTQILTLSATSLLLASTITPSLALTEQQSKGMYRHGIWEWSLRTCKGAMRQAGYWYALKEVGGFPSSQIIVEMESTSEEFKQGWRYMETNARTHGTDRTCDYAFEQWPALLYRN